MVMMMMMWMMKMVMMMMMKYILSSGSSWCHKQDWIAAEKVPAKEETCFLQQETVSPLFCRLQILSILIKSFFPSYWNRIEKGLQGQSKNKYALL